MKKFWPELFEACRTTGAEQLAHDTTVSQSSQTVIVERPRLTVNMKRCVLSSRFLARSLSNSGDIARNFFLDSGLPLPSSVGGDFLFISTNVSSAVETERHLKGEPCDISFLFKR
jgi:hypothetical protein